MLAIDTNLIVRYLTGDHPRQSARARALIDREDIFASTTVILETEWVLRSVYDFSPARVASGVRAFAGLPRVSLEDAALVAGAFDLVDRGMDFADALHLCKAADCEGLVTFDRRFIAVARAAGSDKVREP